MKCRICSNELDNFSYEVREMMYGSKEKFSYFQCAVCKCLQITEFPNDISKYYSKNYYSYEKKSHLYKPNNFIGKFKRYFVDKRNYYAIFNKGSIGKILILFQPNLELSSLSKISLSTEYRILDVGCGVGAHLYFLKELAFDNILGIDPFNETDIMHDNGLKILKKHIHELDTQWDVIMYHHSFEHLSDPFTELKKINKLLVDNGVCIIRIPTVSSYAWNFYKTDWVQIDAPRHSFIHSIESLKLLAERTGFEVSNYYYDSTSIQFWGSEQYKVDIPLMDKRSLAVDPQNSIFSKKELKKFSRRSRHLNKMEQGDQAVFYLKKSHNL